MRPKTNRLLRSLVPAVGVLGAVIGWSSPSHAFVKQIVIDQTATVNMRRSPWAARPPAPRHPIRSIRAGYLVHSIQMILTTPSLPTSTMHPTTTGKVDYIANFQIVTPTNPAQRNGLLIYEVVEPWRLTQSPSQASPVQGATYVQSGWQGDLLSECSLAVAAPYPCVNLSTGPYGTLNTTTGVFTPPTVAVITGTTNLTSYVIQVPVATTDGKAPNGTNTITGPVYSHISPGTNGSTAQLIIGNEPDAGSAFTPYQPVNLDTSQATLWSETSQTLPAWIPTRR